MKNLYLIYVLALLALSVQAQSIDLSLSHLGTNGSGYHEIALMGTPNFDETNGNSADIGAVVSVTSGWILAPGSNGFVNDCPAPLFICEYPIPKGEWDAGSGTLPGPSGTSGRNVYQLLRTPGVTNIFLDAVNGTPITLAVFQLFESPSFLPPAGDIYLIDNTDPLISGITNSNFLNINYPVATGGETNDIVGTIDTSVINFSTLSTKKEDLTGVSLYPNPANENVTIKGVDNLESVQVMNVNGQRIMSFNSNIETINVSNLANGIYFVKLETDVAAKTIKLIKND